MSIRKRVLQSITRELAIYWEVMQHCNECSYKTLEVDSKGKLCEYEEPSSNSWHTGTYVLVHTYGNISCNCDWCAEWEHNDNDVQEEFDDKESFIEECIYNNDSGSSMQEYMIAKVEEIPIGFFDDEDGMDNTKY